MIRERKRGSCASSQEAKKESTAKDKIQQGLAAQAKLQQHRREGRTVLAGWEEQKDSTIEFFLGSSLCSGPKDGFSAPPIGMYVPPPSMTNSTFPRCYFWDCALHH